MGNKQVFLIKTKATMKEHNQNLYWIDIVTDYRRFVAEDIKSALDQWAEYMRKAHYVDVSNNALAKKEPMFCERKDGSNDQVGFVITGKTIFEDSRGEWKQQYIDLWTDVIIAISPFS